MSKYRILKKEYPDGKIRYEVRKKIFGLFWWNFEYDAYTMGIYSTLDDAKMAIKKNKGKTKITIIDC